MTHATAPYRAVLLVKAEAAHEGMSSFRSDDQDHAVGKEMALVRTALLESGRCDESRVLGERLLALFSNADAALEVACAVRRACADDGQGAVLTHLHMLLDEPADHLGAELQHAPGSWNSGRAERLLQQLPAGRIFVSSAIMASLGEPSRAKLRPYEQAPEDVGELYQAACHEETLTRITGVPLSQDRTTGARSLCLRWRDNTMTLVPGGPSLTFGRSGQADIRIESELASRIHAHVGFHDTNFILADRSSNGTFVRIGDDDEVFLHHEQIVLRGSGIISLGQRIGGGRGKLIYFNLTA